MNLGESLPFLAALLMLLLGLAVGKAWERYKLRDGKWIDRRRARESHHYVLGLNFLVSNQIDLAIEELSQAARVDSEALEIHLILGNVHRDSFAAAARSPRFAAMEAAISGGIERCRRGCGYFQLCGGGAPANKYFENGSFDSTETLFCRFTRQAMLDVLLDKLQPPPVAAVDQ